MTEKANMEERSELDDFVDLIGDLTNYIQNQRTASYNEAVDDMLRSVREWMVMHDIRHDDRDLPEMLDNIAHHFKACGASGDGEISGLGEMTPG